MSIDNEAYKKPLKAIRLQEPLIGVEALKNKYINLWWQASSEDPIFLKKVSNRDKKCNRKEIDDFTKKLKLLIKLRPSKPEDEVQWRGKIVELVRKLEYSLNGYTNSCVEFFSQKGYSNITEAFIKAVKEFDDNMDIYDTFQAIRNVWIMNSIQILLGEKVQLTPSVFAYSMLYPYSDNFLDDISITNADKINFNDNFKRALKGEKVSSNSHIEACIYRLINMIEKQFPREKYPKVFDSLLAIHRAQENSLLQQKGECPPYERDIMSITFEKGGTSVLADGYLIKGQLLMEEEEFTFGYGTFLQIIDDLQDAEEDYKNGHITMFSQLAGRIPLDKLTNKLFWYVKKVLDSTVMASSKDAITLKQVIQESCTIMIMEAISKNKGLYSKEYINIIEEYSMVEFSYFKKVKKGLQGTFSSIEIHNICKALSNDDIINIPPKSILKASI